MDESRHNVWVGLFVLCGLGALGALIVLFGQGPTALMARGTYDLNIEFDEIADIREGNLVTVKGITIGRVTNVGLIDPKRFDQGVRVVVSIENEYHIPSEGTKAMTAEPMLGSGRPPIEIIPGLASSDPLPPGGTIRGSVTRALDSLLPKRVVGTFETSARQIGDAAEAMTPVLAELRELLRERSPADVDAAADLQGNLSTVVARFDDSMRHFNEVLGDPEVKSQLRTAVANLHEMSERGKVVMGQLETASTSGRELIDDSRHLVANLDQTVGKLDTRTQELTRSVRTTLDGVDRFMDHMNVIGERVRSGEGNFGRLIMDDKLYESMLITAERMTAAVEEMKGLIQDWREGGKIRVGL